MKAMAIELFGTPDLLKEMDLPKPIPQENEVLIKVTHAGVNPVDWKICQGALKERLPHDFPLILGWDAAGVVEKVGSKIEQYKPGDHVYAYCRKPTVQHGTYAQYIVVDENALAFAPSNISLAEAAGIPLTGLTAWQSLFDFSGLKEGQIALIHAGAGGVGSLAIQFAKFAGATVYTTASAKNHDYLNELGADHIIDYTKDHFVEVMKKMEPAGVDMVFDTVGGDTQQHSFQLVKKGGALVSIVDAPSEEKGKTLGIKVGYVFVSPNTKQLQNITQLIEDHKVRPAMIKEMKLSEAATALKLNQERHVRGKIVLSVQ